MGNIICGNCRGAHASSDEVRSCYNRQVPTLTLQEHAQRVDAPTTKQLDFLRKLVAEREHSLSEREVEQTITAGRRAVSQLIDQLVNAPKHQTPASELEDGIYEKDGEHWKVYHTESLQQVAKRLIVTDTGENDPKTHKPIYKGSWEYEGKRPLSGLTPAHKLREVEAKKFGTVYGFCVNCARQLSREESVFVGYGRTCAGHQNWWYPTKRELRALAEGKPIEFWNAAAR